MFIDIKWDMERDDIGLDKILFQGYPISDEILNVKIKKHKDDVVYILNNFNEYCIKFDKNENELSRSPISGAIKKFKGETLRDLLKLFHNTSKQIIKPNKVIDSYLYMFLFDPNLVNILGGEQSYTTFDKEKINRKYMSGKLTYYDLMTYKDIMEGFYFNGLCYTDKKFFFTFGAKKWI